MSDDDGVGRSLFLAGLMLVSVMVGILFFDIQQEGEQAFKCFQVATVAMLCGLGGAVSVRGSSFMDESNGRNVLLGVH